MNNIRINILVLIPVIIPFLLIAALNNDDEGKKVIQGHKNKEDTSELNLQKGFHARILYSPKKHGQGSWVAMTFDNKGRMITSDQYGNLYRVTLPPIGYDSTQTGAQVSRLPLDFPKQDTISAKFAIGFAHGLLYAFNSLYVMVNDEGEADSLSQVSGLYRLQDTDGDDDYDKITLLKELDGRGEHGPHAIVLGPEKKALYIVAGNFTEIPKMDTYRLPNNSKVDNLLPLRTDPRGFGVGLKPPGGWIGKVSPDGSKWTLVAAGFRNPYDIVFNKDGELFTYDSDMEWDLGLPWYRPTRLCHVIPGADFGYREHDHKMSPKYLDNLPPVVNIGQGSPTAMFTAYNARFPDKYRKGLYAFDWSYGIIYHINLIPDGASYKAKANVFLSGSPLPLTDGRIGPDGAMYFLTGGRRLESHLYRVYYEDGHQEKKPLKFNKNKAAVQARNIMHKLEQYQIKPDPSAIDFAWPYLKNDHRYLRYAARLAIEHQPVKQWKEKALNEDDPIIAIHALLALARNGDKSLEPKILSKLTSIKYNRLSGKQKLDLLRTMEVTLARMGKPEGELKNEIISYVGPKFPTNKRIINREASKILIYVGAPAVAGEVTDLLYIAPKDTSTRYARRTAMKSSRLIFRNTRYGRAIAKMLADLPPAQHIYYAVELSGATSGWTPAIRKKYFKWYNHVFKSYQGGHSFIGYLDEAREAALGNVKSYYSAMSGDSLLSSSGNSLAMADVPQPEGPGREWEVDSALVLVQNGLKNRIYENGKNMFLALSCGSCHRVGAIGHGDIGPDLTQLGTRFSYKDMLEAIINPSKSISSQYAATVYYLKDGSTITGVLKKEQKGNYYVSVNPYAPEKLTEISKTNVTKTEDSDASLMPPGLINRLNPDELENLLAFLKSGGNKKSDVFKKEEK